ncbi:MAG: helix-turn-helix domain-containing protein [Bacteroidota bacterium]|nr:helix-turn-helix domain-containing protein [Bacteroidota bacterium]
MRKRILRIVAESNLGIYEFCEHIGVNYDTFRKWIRGSRTPMAKNIVKICKTCKVSADWLLGLKDNND